MENTDKSKNINNDKSLNKVLDSFLNSENQNEEMDCSSGVCIIKGDRSLVERINKKIITEDGRQLLL